MYLYKDKTFDTKHELALFIYCDDNELNYDEEYIKYERKGKLCAALLFKIHCYVNDTYTPDFMNLFEVRLPFPYPQLINNGDDTVIRYFHKSIYEARRGESITPIEAWQDHELRRYVALNRLQYIGKCDPHSVMRGFNISGIVKKVSVFKASIATKLIKTYLDDVNVIFDPFSGFSGRLIGAQNNNKYYIGQDINSKHIEESKELAEYKGFTKYELSVKDIFESSGEYEALFTCSPYNDKEIWNDTDVNLSCDEWIDICLERFKCKKYLFVVDKTTKYKDYIVEKIENKSHFNISYEYVILITNS